MFDEITLSQCEIISAKSEMHLKALITEKAREKTGRFSLRQAWIWSLRLGTKYTGKKTCLVTPSLCESRRLKND